MTVDRPLAEWATTNNVILVDDAHQPDIDILRPGTATTLGLNVSGIQVLRR